MLIGNSIGGGAAIDYARAEPANVAALVLANSGRADRDDAAQSAGGRLHGTVLCRRHLAAVVVHPGLHALLSSGVAAGRGPRTPPRHRGSAARDRPVCWRRLGGVLPIRRPICDPPQPACRVRYCLPGRCATASSATTFATKLSLRCPHAENRKVRRRTQSVSGNAGRISWPRSSDFWSAIARPRRHDICKFADPPLGAPIPARTILKMPID